LSLNCTDLLSTLVGLLPPVLMKVPSVNSKNGTPPDWGVGGRPVKPKSRMRFSPSDARG
jgi:hypothetical protein